MKRIAALLVMAIAFLAKVEAQEWPTATPESQGMDSGALTALVEYGAKMQMDSLVVVRNGRIVGEAYYGPYRASMKHRINSATKGVVSALTGIAIGRGDLPATTTPLAELIPAAGAAGDARWSKVTLQHLLDMTSGVDWSEPLTGIPLSLLELQRSRNWEQFILARPVVRDPGTVFDYNSGNAHLLSIALMRRTGQPTDAYARKYLFEPLGIADYRWLRDPQGVAIGAFGLYLRTRDMARIGQLYLQRGAWNGRQVIPRDWVGRVFTPKTDMSLPGFRYADFWWSIPARRAYMMVGFNRQVVMVLPDLNVVAAMTGRGNYPLEEVIALLQRAATSATPIPENPQSQAVLNSRVEDVANGPGMPGGEGVKAAVLKGRYRVEDNPLGVREFALDFSASPATYRILMRARELSAPVGLEGRFIETQDSGTSLFTRAAWQDANTLLLEQRWPEEGAWTVYMVKFSGDEAEIASVNGLGMKSAWKAHRIAD